MSGDRPSVVVLDGGPLAGTQRSRGRIGHRTVL